MSTRRVLNIRIDIEIEHYGRQIASSQLRSFPNYIESLIQQDLIRQRKNGVKFNEFEEPGGKVIGSGTDQELVEEFEKLTKKDK